MLINGLEFIREGWGKNLVDYLAENAISILSLIISSSILLGNRGILSKTYRLNRDGSRNEEIVLLFITSKQKEKKVFLKLVLFNPGKTDAIINSFTVYKKIHHPIKVLKCFGFKKWKEIEDARWWPSLEEEAESVRTLREEYANLYVKDYRNIFVAFPGCISRGDYKFFIQTNNGSMEHISNIDAVEIYFAHAYRKWYPKL